MRAQSRTGAWGAGLRESGDAYMRLPCRLRFACEVFLLVGVLRSGWEVPCVCPRYTNALEPPTWLGHQPKISGALGRIFSLLPTSAPPRSGQLWLITHTLRADSSAALSPVVRLSVFLCSGAGPIVRPFARPNTPLVGASGRQGAALRSPQHPGCQPRHLITAAAHP